MLVFDQDNLRASAPPQGPVQLLSSNLQEIPFVFHYKQFDFMLKCQNSMSSESPAYKFKQLVILSNS